MSCRAARDSGATSSASSGYSEDPVAGTCLERELLDAHISSYLKTIDGALEQLIKFTADGFDTSKVDLCQPILDGLSQTTELLRQMLEAPTPQRRTYSETQNGVVFASRLSNYMRRAIDVLINTVFPPTSLLMYVTTFARLHLFYVSMVLKPANKPDVAQFRQIWSHNFAMWSQIGHLIHKVDFPAFIPRLTEFYEAVSRAVNLEGVTNFAQNVGVLVNEIKKKLNMVDAEPTQALIRNLITDLSWFKDKVRTYIDALTDRATADQLLGKLSVVSKQVMVLESCLSSILLVDVMIELDTVVRSDRLQLDPTAYHTRGHQWRIVVQTLELASVEAKSLGFCIGEKFRNPAPANQMAAAAKALAVTMTKHEDVTPGVFRERMAMFTDVTCVIDRDLEETAMQHFRNQVEELKNLVSDRAVYKTLATIMERLETEFQMKTTNGTIGGLAERLVLFRKLETILKEVAELSVDEIDELRTMRKYLCGNILALKLRTISRIVVSVTARWTDSASRQAMNTKHFQIASSIENLASMVSSLMSGRIYVKEARVFIEFFSRYLDVFGIVNTMNTTGDYDDVLHCALASLPQMEMMGRVLPVHQWLREIRETILQIQFRSLRTAALVTEEFVRSDSARTMEVISQSFAESERVHALILYALRRIDNVRLATKVLVFYGSFVKSFGEEPDTPPKFRFDTGTVSAAMVENFPRFTTCLMTFLKAGIIKKGVTSALFRHWLEFLRSVILNEEFDRKNAFIKLLESIPFLDFSAILHDALLNLKMIGSKLHMFKKQHKEKDCTKLIRAFNDLHWALIRGFVVADPRVCDLEGKIKKFVKCSMEVSEELYNYIHDLWPPVMQIFLQLSTLVEFDNTIRVLKNDFALPRTDSEDHLFFGCFFANSIFCTISAMESALRSGLLPTDTSTAVRTFKDAMSGFFSPQNFLFMRPHKSWYQEFAKQNELAKQYWCPSLADGIGERARSYFMNLLSALGSPEMTSSSEHFAKMERIGALLVDLDNDSSEFDKFSLLVEIKSIFDTVQKQSGQEVAVQNFNNVIQLGIMTFFVLNMLVINDFFVGQYRPAKNLDIHPWPSPNAKAARRNLQACPIAQIPRLLESLNQSVKTVSHKSGAPSELLDSLRHTTSNLTRSIQTFFSTRCRDADGFGTVIQSNKTMMSMLRTLAEDHEHMRERWVREEVARDEQMRRWRAELDKLKMETSRCRAELTRVTENLNWTERANAILASQLSQFESTIPPAVLDEEEEEDTNDPSTEVEASAEDVTPEQAELVRRELKQARDQNAKLLSTLNAIECQLGIAQPPSPAKQQPRVWYEPDGTALADVAEKVEQSLIAAIEKFKDSMWSDAGAYRAGSSQLLSEIQRAWSCYHALHTSTNAMRTEITSMENKTVQTRAALVKLLED